jgi:WD40-like Beta Propeller Repeat/Omp85 superfamily domain
MRLSQTLLVSVVILLPLAAHASDRYDPRLRFQTISTPRFDIHYHQGEEAQARRLAAIAETVAAKLDATLGPPSGRVQVILVAQSDVANGWATPLPYNTIEIITTSPDGQSLIGNTTDWLHLVFAHEYTHVVHLSRGRGWIGGLRRVFGRMPLLYPNLYLPLWQIEGIATYEESQLTGEGRVPAGDFHSILTVAAARNQLEPLDRANGGLVDWPSGQTPYVYGAYFHKYLAQEYGDESLRRLTDSTAGRVPYFGSPAFKRVFTRSLGDLWRDFEADANRASPSGSSDPTRLTHHGFSVVGPRFAPDGRIYYSIANPDGFPALLAISPGVTSPRRIANRYFGKSTTFGGSLVIFDQLEVEHQVALQSDLYATDLDGGSSWRLTHGARAADPDVSPDARTIVCTVQRDDRRELATMTVPNGRQHLIPETLISEADTSFAGPRWSPDGRWIAAERGTREIVLIDPAAKKVVRTVAVSSRGRNVTPSWTPDGNLLFASSRDGGAFRIYRTNISTLETSRLEGTGPDAQSPEVSRDGRTLVFVGYTPQGYDLFSVSLDSAVWTRESGDARAEPAGMAQQVDRGTTGAARGYSPWRTLAPRFWTPTLESDSDELVVGAATASADVLRRHIYAAEVGWASLRARPDWQVAYAYARWRPTFFATISDDTDPRKDGEVRTRETNAGVLVPWRRVRWSQSVLGAFHSSTEEFTCSGCSTGRGDEVTRGAVRGGWLVSATQTYGYSISTEDGWSAAITTELARESLGADGDAGAATIDVRGYLPVVPQHAIIAARVAGATTWDEGRVRRVFSAAGNGPQLLGFEFDSDAIGLLRGVEASDMLGRHAVVANLDYRFPLWRIERGAGTLPLFVRTIHGALFADAGQAWNATFRRQDVRVSLGGELSFDSVLGYVLPVTFTAGGSWVSQHRGFAAFGRIGRAF